LNFKLGTLLGAFGEYNILTDTMSLEILKKYTDGSIVRGYIGANSKRIKFDLLRLVYHLIEHETLHSVITKNINMEFSRKLDASSFETSCIEVAKIA